jgi:dsDNA-binding SOS-regulon protein
VSYDASAPLPDLAGTTHLEIQVFDNRKTAKRYSAKMRVKLSALSCPVDQIARSFPAQATGALHDARNCRKAMWKRVTSGSLTAERAAEIDALTREAPKNALMAVIDQNAIFAVMCWDESEVLSLTLHYPHGQISYSGDDGTARRAEASETSALWRAYHDPLDFWSHHKSEVYKAHQRRRDQRIREVAAEGAVQGVMQEFGETIQMLAAEVGALKAALTEKDQQVEDLAVFVTQQNDDISALMARVEELEARPAHSSAAVDDDPPLTRDEMMARAIERSARIKRENAIKAEQADRELAAHLAAQRDIDTSAFKLGAALPSAEEVRRMHSMSGGWRT